VVGVVLREWRRCRRLTYGTIAFALLVLIVAVLALTYGNHIAETSAPAGS
jgi:L-rhamnose-H+ transport protein